MGDEIIYFVSDTHLGDATGADRFLYPAQFMKLLARIEQEPYAQLVLLGDFMELWACSLESVLVAHAPIFRAIGHLAANHPVTYVVGNHDCIPWYYYLNFGLGNVRIVERFVAARGALVALHGHQYDPLNRVKVLPDGQVKAPWPQKLVQVVGFLGRTGGQGTGKGLAELGDALGDAADQLTAVLEHESPGERGYPYGEKAYDEAARQLIRSGFRFVVMGHTHHPLTRHYGNRTYINTGCWVWERYPPTYGRFANGRLELLDANTHQPFASDR